MICQEAPCLGTPHGSPAHRAFPCSSGGRSTREVQVSTSVNQLPRNLDASLILLREIRDSERNPWRRKLIYVVVREMQELPCRACARAKKSFWLREIDSPTINLLCDSSKEILHWCRSSVTINDRNINQRDQYHWLPLYRYLPRSLGTNQICLLIFGTSTY